MSSVRNLPFVATASTEAPESAIMRLLHVAAVAALALFACCDAAVADPKSSKLTSADAAALNDGNNGRFLRKRDAELDTNDEDKAMAELESMTERAGAAKTNYKLFYKAKMTPRRSPRRSVCRLDRRSRRVICSGSTSVTTRTTPLRSVVSVGRRSLRDTFTRE